MLWFWVGADHREIFHLSSFILYSTVVPSDCHIISLPTDFIFMESSPSKTWMQMANAVVDKDRLVVGKLFVANAKKTRSYFKLKVNLR